MTRAKPKPLKPPCQFLLMGEKKIAGRYDLFQCGYELPELPPLPVSVPYSWRNSWPPKSGLVCREYCEACPCYKKKEKP